VSATLARPTSLRVIHQFPPISHFFPFQSHPPIATIIPLFIFNLPPPIPSNISPQPAATAAVIHLTTALHKSPLSLHSPFSHPPPTNPPIYKSFLNLSSPISPPSLPSLHKTSPNRAATINRRIENYLPEPRIHVFLSNGSWGSAHLSNRFRRVCSHS
jgi:hypothetical protein